MQVISNLPLIEILDTEDLGDRLDPPFYKPELVYLERELLEFPYLRRLEDILEPDSGITGGATPSGANYLEAGIPFLRVQNVRDMRLNLENLVFIDEETHQSLKRSQLSKRDVLLTITGAIGISAVYNIEEYPSANINQHIVRLRVNTSVIKPEFLALFFNSSHGYAQSLRKSTGGSRPGLDYSSIRSFAIPCPPIFGQEKILTQFARVSMERDVVLEKIRELETKAEHILSTAKANIFDLLDDEKLRRILAMADEVLKTGTTPEVDSMTATEAASQLKSSTYLLNSEAQP